MVALPKVPYYTPEEYLAIERKARHKSEYLDGEIVAMAGASREHNLIVHNLSRAIGAQLDNTSCEVYPSDMRVFIEATSNYVYPDMIFVCGTPQFTDDFVDTLLNPLVIIEILSPSTERFDRGRKFRDYQTITSLMEYILISQDEPVVDQYVRQTGGWLLTTLSGLDQTLRLATVSCELALSQIYRRIRFEADNNGAHTQS